MLTPDQLAALRAAAKAATPGPWQVVTDEHPHCLGGKHIERRIFTSWEHPQLRDFSPVVTMSVGVPEVAGERAIQMASIRQADADYIAAANPAVVQELLADLEAMAQELLAYRADSSLDTAGATIRAQAARIAELERDAATRDAEIASALPGTYYMDPPDGGDVPLLEQLRRTALDAARYRAFRAELLSADERNEIEDSMRLMVGRVRRLRGDDAYPTTEEFDSAIDAAMEQNQSPNCG
ncbi:hypothetical protein K5M36_17025 [Chromobacterium vaccinii]|nr:hypothetical protein [Chromobacterium vaccinii]